MTKKVTYKGLDKDARNKVLPISAHKSITVDCEPTSATYVDCAAVTLNQSTGFPRRAMIVVDGTFTTEPAGGRGECRLELDNAPSAFRALTGIGSVAHRRPRITGLT